MRDQSTSMNIYREWRRENCERRRCERANKRDTGRSEGVRKRETITGLHRVRVRVRGCRVRQTTLRRQFMPCDGRQISRGELWDLETLQVPISSSHSKTSPTTKVGTMITFYLFENITSAHTHRALFSIFNFRLFKQTYHGDICLRVRRRDIVSYTKRLARMFALRETQYLLVVRMLYNFLYILKYLATFDLLHWSE